VKRGRKSAKVSPVDTSEFDSGDFSGLGKRERNKISASKYRKRRKMYLDSLEAKLQALERKCAQQNDVITSLQSENKVMKEQVSFLQGLVSGRAGSKTKGAAMMFVLFSCFLFCSTGSMWAKYHAAQPLMITDDVSVDGFKGRSLLHIESEALSPEAPVSIAVDYEAKASLVSVPEESEKISPAVTSLQAPFVVSLENKRPLAGFPPSKFEFGSKSREESALLKPDSRPTAFPSFASLLAASEGKLNVSLSTLELVDGTVPSFYRQNVARSSAELAAPSRSPAPLTLIPTTGQSHNDCWTIPPSLERDPFVFKVDGIRSLVRHVVDSTS